MLLIPILLPAQILRMIIEYYSTKIYKNGISKSNQKEIEATAEHFWPGRIRENILRTSDGQGPYRVMGENCSN